MASTSQGLPYPAPTDPVSAGADDIRRLATAAQTYVQTGTVVVTVPAGTNPQVGSAAVTFAVPFAVAPNVVCSFAGAQPQNVNAGASTPSTTGVTINVARLVGSGSNFGINWIAVGRITPPT